MSIAGFGSLLSIDSARSTFPDLRNFRIRQVCTGSHLGLCSCCMHGSCTAPDLHACRCMPADAQSMLACGAATAGYDCRLSASGEYLRTRRQYSSSAALHGWTQWRSAASVARRRKATPSWCPSSTCPTAPRWLRQARDRSYTPLILQAPCCSMDRQPYMEPGLAAHFHSAIPDTCRSPGCIPGLPAQSAHGMIIGRISSMQVLVNL